MSRCVIAERGAALVVALLGMSLLLALGLALATVTTTETAIAAGYRDATAVLYAAEGIVEQVVGDLTQTEEFDRIPSDWSLHAAGPFEAWLPAGMASAARVEAWVARDAARTDVVWVLGHAYGDAGSFRAIEVSLMRTAPPPSPLRLLSWREVR